MLKAYPREWIINIEDISQFVQQRHNVQPERAQLVIPQEKVYPVANIDTNIKLGLAPYTACN